MREQNANDDRQLIDRDQFAAHLRGRDFGDIHRRKIGRQTNGHAAENAPGDENRETGCRGIAQRSDGKKQRGDNQQSFAAKLVAQGAGEQCPKQTADKRATVGPADLRFAGQLKISLEERLGAADDHPVPAKQQTAHRGNHRDKPDVTKTIVGFQF